MEIIKRKSARAVLLTPQNEVLLIKISNPKGKWSGWITPGGGIDEGETEAQGLRRELFEELGFDRIQNEIKIWTRFHRFPWNEKTVEQEEVFFLVRTEKFSPSSRVNLTESEMLDFKEMQWWSLEQIQDTNEEFAPSAFPALLEKIVSEGPPSSPFDCGV